MVGLAVATGRDIRLAALVEAERRVLATEQSIDEDRGQRFGLDGPVHDGRGIIAGVGVLVVFVR